MDEYYSQNKETKDGTRYIYYNPRCKSCVIKNNIEWSITNPDKRKEIYTKYNNSDTCRVARRRHNGKVKVKKRYKNWQKNNPDKLKQYASERQHKAHNITNDEWINCKEYFNYECAYCDISEVYHKEIFKQDLHKDHFVHDGSNGIDNCVPACKSCNSSKGELYFEEWISRDDVHIEEVKINRIKEWFKQFKTK